MSFFTVVFPGKKQSKQVGNMPEIQKKLLRSADNTFLKNFSKMHKF